MLSAAQFRRVAKDVAIRLHSVLAPLIRRLRHPSRRGIALTLAAVPVSLLLYALILIPFTPGISDIRKATQERPAQILFADGRKMTEFKASNRQWVKLDDIAAPVIDALIATEDHRFYEHHGIDWRRTAAAGINTFKGDRQGGSTITQQLARNLYPEEIGRAPTLTRKLKEAITAFKIEALHSKDEILETYLNTVPFLYNAFGIEMAARTYFDVSAGALDTLQSATLVGMLKGNSYYNPVSNPERALQRRNTVLAQMLRRGKLTPAKFESLKKRPLRVDFERQTEAPGPAPHFTRQLRKWLIAWADENDFDIYRDGLIVHTTLDSRLQALASQAVARQGEQLQKLADAAWNRRRIWSADNPLVQDFVHESPEYAALRAAGEGLDEAPEEASRQLFADAAFLRKLREQKTRIEAGFVAIDPTTAAIRAWVGSRDAAIDGFDHVQQAQRQPGSTFKAFVYGEAFRQGLRPDDNFIDAAVDIPIGGDEIWRPRDDTPPTGREMRLADALAYSKNTITAQLMMKVGPAKVARLARKLGIRQSELDAVPALALGTSPVTLKEMVSAYASIADGGEYRAPLMVTRIDDADGRPLAEFAPATPERALDADVAYILLDALRGVIDRGTGRAIRSRVGIRADVAGKTGTTQDNADGWFILMHPQLVAGAWVGFNDGRITLRSDYWGQGAHSALPIVGDFFHGTLRARLIDAQLKFAPPDDASWLRRWSANIRNWWNANSTAPTHQPPAPVERPSISEIAKPPAPSAPPTGDTPTSADPLQELIDKIQEEGEEGGE